MYDHATELDIGIKQQPEREGAIGPHQKGLQREPEHDEQQRSLGPQHELAVAELHNSIVTIVKQLFRREPSERLQ